MILQVIAVKNARVSEDLEHINARVLHQTLMILNPYSRNLTQKKPTRIQRQRQGINTTSTRKKSSERRHKTSDNKRGMENSEYVLPC